jgi:FkbM family methyltransferase
VNYFGYKIYFPKNIGGSILNAIYWKKNGFEPEIGYLMNLLSKRSSVFIDIGSNIGIYSVLVQKSNPEIICHCVEPIKELCDKIKIFHTANNVKNYHLYNIALSDFTGSTKIFVPTLDEFNETTTASLSDIFFYNQKLNGENRLVNTFTFYDFIDKHGIDLHGNILVKIDVEGHEISVLREFEKIMLSHSPIVFLEMEMKKDTFDAYFDFGFNQYYTTFYIFNGFILKVSKEDLRESRSAKNFLLIPNSLLNSKKSLYYFDDLKALAPTVPFKDKAGI